MHFTLGRNGQKHCQLVSSSGATQRGSTGKYSVYYSLPFYNKTPHIPLLKKSSLDHEEFKNFRPISNLKFVSKVIGIVVAAQVKNYLHHNDLHETFQSAYRKYH